ncbi:hypothetical protein ScPMuIL_005803 [Solemya velum]
MAIVLVSGLVLMCAHLTLSQPFPGPGFGPVPGPPPFGFMPGGPVPMGPGGRPPFGGPGRPPFGQQGGTLDTDPYLYATCYFNETLEMMRRVRGRVDMRQLRMGGPGAPLQIRVQVVGLPRSRMSDMEHGMHVHQFGDTGRSCFKTGPHFDTDGMSFHGPPSGVPGTTNHDGDLGNFRQSNDGVINTNFTAQISLAEIAGRAIVLHEGRDDLGRGGNPLSLQTGNAGRALSCCSIGFADSTNWDFPFIPAVGNGFTPGFTNTGFNSNDQFNQGFTNTGSFGNNGGNGQFNNNNGQFNTGMVG